MLENAGARPPESQLEGRVLRAGNFGGGADFDERLLSATMEEIAPLVRLAVRKRRRSEQSVRDERLRHPSSAYTDHHRGAAVETVKTDSLWGSD